MTLNDGSTESCPLELVVEKVLGQNCGDLLEFKSTSISTESMFKKLIFDYFKQKA
jgi:hypothetical protein